jgi:diacylglycerol kinase
MGEQIRKHHISFSHAFAGIRWALSTQPNFRIHLTFSLLAVLTGLYVGLTASEWVLLVFTIFWGLSAEMINTALEAVCDLITKEWRTEIRVAKDVAAGMMLTVATGAIVVALFLLLPKLVIKFVG